MGGYLADVVPLVVNILLEQPGGFAPHILPTGIPRLIIYLGGVRLRLLRAVTVSKLSDVFVSYLRLIARYVNPQKSYI